MFNMFSGGALSRFTIFALGIMPYISASIIMQLMTVVSPQLEALKKEGEAGRRKITQYTRYGTVVLALFQALGISIALEVAARPGDRPGPRLPLDDRRDAGDRHHVPDVAGRADHRARARQRHLDHHLRAASRRGCPTRSAGTLELVRTGAMTVLVALLIVAIVVAVTAFVVFVERGQRKILVNYAKRQVGNKVYGGQSSHLPLKLNMAGVIPPIFASSIILFPATLASWFGTGEQHALAEGHRGDAVAGAADLRDAVRGGDHLLLLLLHGAASSTRRRRPTT